MGDKTFDILIFAILFEGNAFDSIKVDRMGEFGGQDDMAEATFSQFPDGFEMGLGQYISALLLSIRS